MTTTRAETRAQYHANRAFIRQVDEFSQLLARKRERTKEYLANVAPRVPELEAAVATIEEQAEELSVAEEELRAQIEALEEAAGAAARERARYRELFEAVSLALLVVDRAGVVHAANRAAEQLFAADAAHLRGRAFAALASAQDAAALRGLLERRDGAADVGLARVRGANFRAHVTCAPLDEDRTLVVVERVEEAQRDLGASTAQLARALRDKDELLQRERALRERLERTDSAKDRFIAVLSHDLRGPINAVLGWTRILKNEQLPVDARTRALETIERSTRTQLALVEELLDLSRIAADKIPLELRPLDLRACARHVVELMSPLAIDAGIVVTTDFDEDPTPIFADRERIVQIVTNLLSNAIKFTPGGGHVNVRVRSEASHATLTVEDDGRGVDPAMLPHLFECYRQGADPKTARTGLGLGLYIVRRLIELHGGTIEAASEGCGKGSRFTMRLPLAEQHAEPAIERAIPAEESTVDLDHVRVLVVDDDPDSRDLLAAVFSDKGASVFAAGDASQAFAMFTTCTPDVIVSDLDMPGEDGCSLVRRIHSAQADVPAIAVSGCAAAKDAERAHDAGFEVHLPKPVDTRELVSRIRELAKQRK